jgi:thymidylate kinase
MKNVERPGFIIEFLGSTCSGKTTLLKEAQSAFSQRGKTVYLLRDSILPLCERQIWAKLFKHLTPEKNRDKLLKGLFYYFVLPSYTIRYICSHTCFALYILKQQFERNIPLSHKIKVLKWFFNTAGFRKFVANTITEDEIIIFDEGIIQRTLNLYTSERETADASDVMKLINNINLPDMIIFVTSPLSHCVDRIENRNLNFRLRGKNKSSIVEFIKNQLSTASLVKNIIKEKCHIIELANIEIEQTISHLQYKIKEINKKPVSCLQ